MIMPWGVFRERGNVAALVRVGEYDGVEWGGGCSECLEPLRTRVAVITKKRQICVDGLRGIEKIVEFFLNSKCIPKIRS